MTKTAYPDTAECDKARGAENRVSDSDTRQVNGAAERPLLKLYASFTPAPPLAAIIPVYDELDYIEQTLESLEQAGAFFCARTRQKKAALVVCVINNRADADERIRERQRLTYEAIRDRSVRTESGLLYAVVDAFTPGNELPAGDGVGLARKLGMDAAARLQRGAGMNGGECLLACLDADTLVERDYFSVLDDFIKRPPPQEYPENALYPNAKKARGAVLSFSHQRAASPEEDRAIEAYERFMRTHSQKLREAGSPYYFCVLGSAIVCTADAYAAAGGMNRRTAGEDFYFAQRLIKTGRFQELNKTRVHPSARISSRVPFGTGREIARILDGGDTRAFPDFCYKTLRAYFELVSGSAKLSSPPSGNAMLTAVAREVSVELALFLQNARFSQIWDKLIKNGGASYSRRFRSFHCWFDGLKTIRLFHYLCSAVRDPSI